MTSISQAAMAAGIGVETIRFYERKGLIAQPPRPTSGARDYGGETLARLRFITGAKRLGFSLAEIAELLDLRAAPDAGCRTVQSHALAKRVDVQARIDGLMRIRDALDALIETCPGEGDLAGCSIIGAIEGARESQGSAALTTVQPQVENSRGRLP